MMRSYSALVVVDVGAAVVEPGERVVVGVVAVVEDVIDTASDVVVDAVWPPQATTVTTSRI
jgi:hypothetical protein